MKRTAIFAVILIILVGCKRGNDKTFSKQPVSTPTPSPAPAAATSSRKWKTVEEFDYALNLKQVMIHFKLELPEGYDDPGDFIRIGIQVNGQPEFALDNDDGWIAYNSSEHRSRAYGHLQESSLVRSRYVLVLPDSERNDVSPLIVLRSWGYASSPERLHVIGFQPSGQPVVLFNGEFDLSDLRDLDGDGFPELVGLPCMSEGVGRAGSDMGTYRPYQVYKIPHPITGPATLSIPLTKKYTTQEYDGWAGPQCTDDFILVWSKDRNKKPLVVTKEQADKLARATTSK